MDVFMQGISFTPLCIASSKFISLISYAWFTVHYVFFRASSDMIIKFVTREGEDPRIVSTITFNCTFYRYEACNT